MLTDNSFTRDDDDTRRERLVLFSANIGDYSVEFGLTPARLALAEGALDAWDTAVSDATRESGETHEATEELKKAFDEAKEYYVAAKDHLLAIIYEISKPDRVIDAYGFNKDTPRTYDGLCSALITWVNTHAKMVAALDPRVVNATVIATLTAHQVNLDTLKRGRAKEKDDEVDAWAAKSSLFDAHSKLLDFIFTDACLTWGKDDSNLRLLGFVPSSEIWTPGGGVNPEIGIPEDLASEIIGADVRVFWHAVVGADEYQLSHTMHPPLFLQLYEGAETEFLHVSPDAGTHYYKVRTKVGDTYGEWSEQIEVEVAVAAPNPPINLILTLGMVNDVKATWEAPSGVFYDGCSIYYVDVANGSPEPAMPTAPYFDELIVYTLTLPVLASGKTRYVWVTGTKNGAESDPCGPQFISIP
jgi:hypothetical protein